LVDHGITICTAISSIQTITMYIGCIVEISSF